MGELLLRCSAYQGLHVGVYDARQRAVSESLQAEREYARDLSTRLSVLNRILRHDIRTNVTVIKGNADQIISGRRDPTTAASVIREQAETLYSISEDARRIESYLSGSEGEPRPIDVTNAVDRIVGDLRASYPDATIETDLPAEAVARTDPMIDEALEHLIGNGLEHNDEDPWVRVEGTAIENRVVVRILDDGPGIPRSEIDVLERGEETAMEHTSGLGLWIAKWVIEAAGGDLTFAHRDPAGTIATVTLPVPDSSEPTNAPGSP